MDPGSHTTRIGYSGEETPRIRMDSVSGVIETITQPNSSKKTYYVDEKMALRRDRMQVVPFVSKGYINNFEIFEEAFQHSIVNKMSLNPKEHAFLLSESPFHDKEYRFKILQLLFDKFQVPAVFIVNTAVLSAFSCGRSTCLVLDCGHDLSISSPVNDGYVLSNSLFKTEIAGRYLSQILYKQLIDKGIEITPHFMLNKKLVNEQIVVDKRNDMNDTDMSFTNFHIMEIIRDIKESCLKVPENINSELGPQNIGADHYELPDNKIIDLTSERYKIPNLLFNNSPDFPGFAGLHRMAIDSISSSDIDIRKDLYSNIVVCGGTTLMSSFMERMQKNITEISGQNIRTKIIAHSINERRFSSWIGGSILSSLGTFQQMWMSKQEYEDQGAILIERKCA